MPGLVTAARWEMIILLGGLMAIVLGKILTGSIATTGLLRTSKDDNSFSPGRVQMLMATVIAGMYYLLQVIDHPTANSLPQVPNMLVGVVGGSHAIFLGGKAQILGRLLSGRRR